MKRADGARIPSTSEIPCKTLNGMQSFVHQFYIKTKPIKRMRRTLQINERLLFILKYSLIQFLFTLAIISMANAHGLSAQVLDKKVSIKLENVSLRAALAKIELAAEVEFLYQSRVVSSNVLINVAFSEERLANILQRILEPHRIRFEADGNQIILTKEVMGFIEETMRNGYDNSTDQLDISISGKITDEQNQSLPGVNILIKGTTLGTTSDANGEYTLAVPNENSILLFSFIGYTTQEISVNGRSVINVALVEDLQKLDEVVVVGYGTQEKTTLTGSVSTVRGDRLQTSPSINFTNSLSGRLPGLVAVTRGGEPGADGATLRIRGANTLGDNSPLIVIDGIANRSMERLNPADIESITVLKDASAAIYGAQAANGVILITTKRGALGKPQITVSFNEGWSMPTIITEMTDAATFAQQTNEIFSYRGMQPRYTDEEIQKFKDGSDPWRYPNTDWYRETFKTSAQQRYGNIALQGGSENLTYFVTIGSNFQDGIYKNSATNYSQTSFRSNLDGKISKNVRLSLDLTGRQENTNRPAFAGNTSTLFHTLKRMLPVNPAYWPNGLPGPDIEQGLNPVVAVTDQTGYNREKKYVMQSNIKLDIIIPWVDGLSIVSNYAIDKDFRNQKLWQKPWHLYSWDKLTYDENNMPLLIKAEKGFSEPRLTQTMSDGSRTTFNAMMNYDRSISEKHNFKVLLGTERIVGESMTIQAFRRHFISAAVDQIFAGGNENMNTGGTADQNARLNYFGRLNYNFNKKYMAELVFRYDGSYIFPAAERFGFFPGVSLGWSVSEESFWKNNLAFINYFKLRASWGRTGNDRIEPYQFLSSYGFGNDYVFNGNEVKALYESRIPNPQVTWEVANQSNIGFDGDMLNGNLQFSADYFYNLRTNILWMRNASVPGSSGLILPRENIGEVVNQGFEFQVGYNNRIGELVYGVSANVAYQRNKIEFWDETPGVPEYQKSTGHPMNSQMYYNAIGIFKDAEAVAAYPHWEGARPGDIIFEDVNDDKQINGLDMVRNYKTDLPTFTGGINIDLKYKSFYASVLFQGATGAVRNNFIQFAGLAGNYLREESEGRWTENDTDATKPRSRDQITEYWAAMPNTYWLRSTDYMRLKNAEIGYNISNAHMENLGINGLRFYLNGLNLLTFTGLTSFDPESNSINAYPLNKVYNVGMSLTF